MELDTIFNNVPRKVKKIRRSKKKRPPHKSKMVTGYIIYASEIRKDVIKKYPDKDFGDISKLVGIEWKNLPLATKLIYEKRAREQNAKSKAIAAEALEIKRLADAAEVSAKMNSPAPLQQQDACQASRQQPLPSICNNLQEINGHSEMNNNMLPVAQHPQVIHMDAHLMQQQQQQSYHQYQHYPCQVQQHQQQHPQYQEQHLQQPHQYQVSPMKGPMQQQASNYSQQQPLQIIHQQQPLPYNTMVQYCNDGVCISNAPQLQLHQPTPSMIQESSSSSEQEFSSTLFTQNQKHFYDKNGRQKNNIIYRKPATVKLRPQDASTQTDPIQWVEAEPKKPLKFSQKFIEHLKGNESQVRSHFNESGDSLQVEANQEEALVSSLTPMETMMSI